MSSKLIIKSHHPWKHRVKIGAVVAGLLLVAWWVFKLGHSRAGYDYDEIVQERDALLEQLDTAQSEIQGQRERIAVLERAGQIDKKGYDEVEASLKQAQDEMLGSLLDVVG